MRFRTRTALAFAGIFAACMPLHATTNFDRTSWTDGPILLSVEFSEVSATNGSMDAATLSQAAASAAARWNAILRLPLFQILPGAPELPRPDNQRNEFYFSTTISPTRSFGAQFGYAATRRDEAGRLFESDLIFNPVHRWLFYHGPLAHETNGDRVPDLYRVALHEMGHILGLAHPPDDTALTIMRSRMSDIDDLTPDDIEDGQRVARFLFKKNVPRFSHPRQSILNFRKASFQLRGTAAPFFVSAMIVKIDAGGNTRRVVVQVDRLWSHRIPLEAGQNRLRFYYRASGGALRRFAVKRITRQP